GAGDLSLYDKDGLTIARIVQSDGRYHLRSPLSWPRQTWPDLKHGAETFALVSLPLDPAPAKRIAKDTPHRTRWGRRSISHYRAKKHPSPLESGLVEKNPGRNFPLFY